MKPGKQDDGFRMSNALWGRMEPLLPAPKTHLLGCHRPRVPNRAAMEAILLVLRTGMQWNALDETGICSCSAAYRRFREWVNAGVFENFWRLGLLEYDDMRGIDWSWLALDGTTTKAPLGGEKNRDNGVRVNYLKVSQNRPPADRAGVEYALRARRCRCAGDDRGRGVRHARRIVIRCMAGVG